MNPKEPETPVQAQGQAPLRPRKPAVVSAAEDDKSARPSSEVKSASGSSALGKDKDAEGKAGLSKVEEKAPATDVAGDQSLQCDLRFHNDEIDFESFCPIAT